MAQDLLAAKPPWSKFAPPSMFGLSSPCHGGPLCDVPAKEMRPILIVCHEDLTCIDGPQTEALRPRFDGVLYFPTATCFTRWLFAQERGEVLQRCLLLTGWREAQSCAVAIAAVRRAKPEKLRRESKRPQLRQPVGECSAKRKSVAVGKMLVLVTPGRQQQVASEWARSGSASAGLPIHIAVSNHEAAEHLALLARLMTVKVSRASF
mmetsp:Transcript_63018/g.136842  ORF Transcript_63018/g.136842 Transcript_63018/m.136842 type:complete len:207 (-) Transcript_63018:159-779(-)